MQYASLHRLFLAALTASDGRGESLILSSAELRLLCSLLICTAAVLPEARPPHDEPEVKIEWPPEPVIAPDAEEAADEIGLEIGDDRAGAPVTMVGVTREKEANGYAATGVSHRRQSRGGPWRRGKNPQRNRRIKERTTKSDLACCICGKEFVRPEGLARHMSASHVLARVGAVSPPAVRCLFEGCDFETAVESSSGGAGGRGVELREHELIHRCPLCRSVYPTQDQIRWGEVTIKSVGTYRYRYL